MARGRDQREPMERLVRIAAALSAQPKYGVPVEKLVAIAGFASTDSGREQLKRELRHLERQGWQFVRTSREGQLATYRMVTVDNRLKVRLSIPQAAALQRAALVAKRSDLLSRLGLPQDDAQPETPADLRVVGEEAALDEVLEAVRLRAMVRFRYKGSTRLASPQSVGQQNGNWYLRAIEKGADEAKTFLVARMSDVVAVEPGTAPHIAIEQHLDLHPMRWSIDPPVEVTLRTEVAFRPDVVRWMLEPTSEETREGRVEMRYQVTNRSAFRDRIYELGTRVEILGPAEVRDEMLAELALLAQGGR